MVHDDGLRVRMSYRFAVRPTTGTLHTELVHLLADNTNEEAQDCEGHCVVANIAD